MTEVYSWVDTNGDAKTTRAAPTPTATAHRHGAAGLQLRRPPRPDPSGRDHDGYREALYSDVDQDGTNDGVQTDTNKDRRAEHVNG